MPPAIPPPSWKASPSTPTGMRSSRWADETQRSQLFVDQKLVDDRSFVAIRFEGLEPVLPPAVSIGSAPDGFPQCADAAGAVLSASRLRPSEDPVPRGGNGSRVRRHGSFCMTAHWPKPSARAPRSPCCSIRSSRTGMRLVDGGLVSNIPVDIARAAGCDIVIVRSRTSGLRTADEMKSPWETADQIMGIMMKRLNEAQMQKGDLIITPAIGRHLSSSFHGLR
ncbi:MAG: hypothetical protein MZV64_31600 [Ignavibacteriales bacterium]|nr:hypothetical protein [Ignavibacteriales bacterium]